MRVSSLIYSVDRKILFRPIERPRLCPFDLADFTAEKAHMPVMIGIERSFEQNVLLVQLIALSVHTGATGNPNGVLRHLYSRSTPYGRVAR